MRWPARAGALAAIALLALAPAAAPMGRAPRAPAERPVTLRFGVSPDTARIGEPVRVAYEVWTPAGAEVRLAPKPPDDSLFTWSGWTVAKPQETAAGVRHRLVGTALPFRAGDLPLPRLTASVRRAGAGAATSVRFGAHLLRVASVLPAGADTLDIRGPKGVIDPPWWARVPWWAIAAVVAALATLFFAWRWWRKRRRSPAAPARGDGVVASTVPAHEEALAALAALVLERLPEAGRLLEHQTRLVAIVRRFLERRFGSPQPGYTTRELCLHLVWRGVPERGVERLRALLRIADLAKFARTPPDVETAHRHEAEARALIEAWTEPAAGAADAPPLARSA
jgi:hypothetical protein